MPRKPLPPLTYLGRSTPAPTTPNPPAIRPGPPEVMSRYSRSSTGWRLFPGQPFERTVPQVTLGRDVTIFHLGQQVRLDPRCL